MVKRDPLEMNLLLIVVGRVGGNSQRWVSSLGQHIGPYGQNMLRHYRLDMMVNMIGGIN